MLLGSAFGFYAVRGAALRFGKERCPTRLCLCNHESSDRRRRDGAAGAKARRGSRRGLGQTRRLSQSHSVRFRGPGENPRGDDAASASRLPEKIQPSGQWPATAAILPLTWRLCGGRSTFGSDLRPQPFSARPVLKRPEKRAFLTRAKFCSASEKAHIRTMEWDVLAHDSFSEDSRVEIKIQTYSSSYRFLVEKQWSVEAFKFY